MATNRTHDYTSPLRYPGGKGVLANYMKLLVAQNALMDGQYVEIYAGGAGIAWALLFEEYIQRVHINDINVPLYSFWYSVLNYTEDLCRLINDTPVTMDEWYRQQHAQREAQQCAESQRPVLGFSTFFLNRTNRSGIMNGGVSRSFAVNTDQITCLPRSSLLP